MGSAITALLSSRKFFVGMLTMMTVIVVVILRAFDKLPAEALVPTMASISAIGLGIIGSIAWEDAAAKGALATATNLEMLSALKPAESTPAPVVIDTPSNPSPK